MIATDEAALVCDFMETYHVQDFRALPARRAAVYAAGLGPGSRIMRTLADSPVEPVTLLLALISDALHVLVWQNTRDGHEGRNPPESIAKRLLGQTGETVGFGSAEDFDAWRASMMRGEDNA